MDQQLERSSKRPACLCFQRVFAGPSLFHAPRSLVSLLTSCLDARARQPPLNTTSLPRRYRDEYFPEKLSRSRSRKFNSNCAKWRVDDCGRRRGGICRALIGSTIEG